MFNIFQQIIELLTSWQFIIFI